MTCNKTVFIQESIRAEIYSELLDFGKGKLKDGIESAVYLAQTMQIIQRSQTNESTEIWRRMFSNQARWYETRGIGSRG